MSQDLIPFEFDQQQVRCVIINGEPFFIASDVCKILGLSNVSKAIMTLDDDEKAITQGNTVKGKQKMSCVSESGLYSLTFKSQKTEAKKFRKWVTSVVLPSIRKTGTFSINPNQSVQQVIAQNIHTASDMLRLKDKINEKRVPKDYVSVLQILARILYKVEADLNQALDPNACTEISAGKAFAQHCRNVLGIPDNLVITYPHLLNNGKEVQAKAYPGRYEHDLRIYIENDYLPNKFPEYASYRKQSIQKLLPTPKRKLIP